MVIRRELLSRCVLHHIGAEPRHLRNIKHPAAARIISTDGLAAYYFGRSVKGQHHIGAEPRHLRNPPPSGHPSPQHAMSPSGHPSPQVDISRPK